MTAEREAIKVTLNDRNAQLKDAVDRAKKAIAILQPLAVSLTFYKLWKTNLYQDLDISKLNDLAVVEAVKEKVTVEESKVTEKVTEKEETKDHNL